MEMLFLLLLLCIGINAQINAILVNNPKRSDVQITTKGGEILYAHSVILELVSNSSYFQAVLSDNWKEVHDDIYMIDLSNYDKDIILPVLYYVYTREINVCRNIVLTLVSEQPDCSSRWCC